MSLDVARCVFVGDGSGSTLISSYVENTFRLRLAGLNEWRRQEKAKPTKLCFDAVVCFGGA